MYEEITDDALNIRRRSSRISTLFAVVNYIRSIISNIAVTDHVHIDDGAKNQAGGDCGWKRCHSNLARQFAKCFATDFHCLRK